MARSCAADARVDDRGAVAIQIVGIVLVHNEDLYVEQAIRNVAAFCDEIHAFDHVSTDGTWDILERLAREIDHLYVRRTHHAGDSHTFIERYAGTDTWAFGVDGDELYDPHRLAALRQELLGGGYENVFKVAANVVNCVELGRAPATATGYPSPPSRSITKLYNFAAIESWAGDGSERLHGGTISFRPGFDEGSVDNIGERLSWDETPLRCLHLCFVRRSTADPDDPAPRAILMESGLHDRTMLGAAKRRLLRRQPPGESAWKQEKYMRGDLVTVEATPFFS
jgi:glycosyltransferase involved in cell wall biosynthesis